MATFNSRSPASRGSPSPAPGHKIRQVWTPEEDRMLSEAVAQETPAQGPISWHKVASHLSNRNNKDCRKRWHYSIANTIRKGTWMREEDERLRQAVEIYGARWSKIAEAVGTRNGDQCWKRWYDCLDPRIDKSPWTAEEDARLLYLVSQHGRNWSDIVHQHFPNRTSLAAKNRYSILRRKQEGNFLPSPHYRLDKQLYAATTPAMDHKSICSQAQGASWRTLPAFLRNLCPAITALSEGEGDNWFDDPRKVEYVRQLIKSLYEARAIVASYNAILLAVILVLAFRHWQEAAVDKQKWRRLTAQSVEENMKDRTASPTASSSSGIVTGTLTPSGAAKDLDVERVPLLAGNGRAPTPRRANAVTRAVRSWLAQQPPPIPIINRTLPSNGTSLFVLAWLSLNVFVHFFRLPMRWDFFFIFADRAGFVFIVNLPLLYLLSAKNQPIRQLTGYSYEALNIFHRRVGELMCFEAAVHFVSMVIWQFVLAEDFLLATKTAYTYFTHPLILCGIGALAAYELLFFTSLASFRQRWYEIFLAAHVLLQIAALVFLWCHFYTSRPYVTLALLIFLADRLVWRLTLKRATLTADMHILDANTYQLSASWDIPHPPRKPNLFWQRQSILHGWSPTDHVFLSIPALGRTHSLQAHPFTIASPAPGRPSQAPSHPHPNEGTTTGKRENLTLLIRAQAGFTRELLSLSQPSVEIVLDGPYGSPHALSMLRAAGLFLASLGVTSLMLLSSTGEAVHLTRAKRSNLVSSVRKGLTKAGFGNYSIMAGVLKRN
ncbi:hypothetical protein N0V88_006553 [Collariella sp. IMI 366227]|nr:hypothetical protein N0V88_006553 [Collariella sp. IMI 366227]